MANAILSYNDYCDRGTVTASSELINLPAINLQHPQLSPFVWRSNATNSAWLQCDFGQNRDVDVVALFATNLTTASTWRVRLDSDSGFAAPHSYDSGTVATGVDTYYASAIHVLPSTVTARYLRVDLADTSLTYLEAARMFAALGWRLTRNFAFGLRERWDDATRATRAETGQVWVDKGAMFRTWSLDLPAITEAERRSHLARMGRFARARDVLFVKDPASTNLGRDSIFGLPETVPEPRHDRFGWYSMSLTIVERL